MGIREAGPFLLVGSNLLFWVVAVSPGGWTIMLSSLFGMLGFAMMFWSLVLFSTAREV